MNPYMCRHEKIQKSKREFLQSDKMTQSGDPQMVTAHSAMSSLQDALFPAVQCHYAAFTVAVSGLWFISFFHRVPTSF